MAGVRDPTSWGLCGSGVGISDLLFKCQDTCLGVCSHQIYGLEAF